jgi:TatD DNase family protein
MFIDIGANLGSEMFEGNYRGKQRHDADLDLVLQRAWDNHLEKIIITAGTLEESREAFDLAKTDDRLFCTVGVHPTRCSQEFGETEESWSTYITNLRSFVEEHQAEGSIAAFGELGLDYARLEFCDAETQKKGLLAQLEVAKDFDLPLFLHNRETGKDLLHILKEHYFTGGKERAGGVVHSFDDTLELAQEFMDLGLYIGINGCSLKTEDNLKVVKALPLDKLMLETDCPYCDIRQSHAGSGFLQTKFETKNEKKYSPDCCVKGRYEPCHIVQVCEVVAGVKGISVEEVASASKENAMALFKLK